MTWRIGLGFYSVGLLMGRDVILASGPGAAVAHACQSDMDYV